MKTDTPRPILLKDYKPSPYVIEATNLDVVLAPTATRVVARSKVRPNPAAQGRRGPLVLDGEMLALERIAIDGKELAAGAYSIDASTLTIKSAPDKAFKLEIATTCNPEANKAVIDRTPMKRWADPSDMAGPVLFLCSPAAAFVTGVILPVDGGYLVM